MKSFASKLLVCNFAITTFVSALLLFEVQPIISKFILPWFGGSPAVWTTCMVFFQTLLFAGYAYAHLSQKYLQPRTQALLHISLLGTAILLLPIAPDLSWRMDAESAPTWRILCLLTVSVGLPYFALSATGPLIQAWFCRAFAERSPYRLYALSNLGSLIALLGYPFYVEPRFAVGRQAGLWTLGFVLFAVLCAVSAISAAWSRRAAAATSAAKKPQDVAQDKPPLQHQLAWLALPALASLMLLATTNHVCQDVAVMPFLWVAPLSLYLLTFMICFDHPRWYWRREYALAALVTLGATIVVDRLITGGSGASFTFVQELVLHFLGLFCLCMICHGELFRLRPHPRHLTSFYLMISAGGALGGMFVSLAAPRLFTSFAEWRLGLIAGCLLAAWVVFEGQPQSFFRRRFAVIAPALFLIFAGLNYLPQFQMTAGREFSTSARNFYGVISVVERHADDPAMHSFNFYSGRIVHGLQFTDPAKSHKPTAYFGPHTGIGQTFATVSKRQDLRVGVIGLGIGTLAVYAEPGNYFRFYELNSDVLDFANEYFSYLRDCSGKYDVVLGDGRLSLEREEPQRFDLLVLDAFSGDAVPTHLLTVEAFEIYRQHLQPNATIAINISNRYLDLSPVAAGLADHFGFDMRKVDSAGDPQQALFPATWVILSPRKPGEVEQHLTSSGTEQRKILWTDAHSNLFEILK